MTTQNNHSESPSKLTEDSITLQTSSKSSQPTYSLHQRSSRSNIEDIRIISWNINGLRDGKKIETLHRMAGNVRPLVILLQETHSPNEGDLDHLRNKLKKYIWYKDEYKGKNRGLAIGIRRMGNLEKIKPVFFERLEGGMFGLNFKIGTNEFSILNIYRHNQIHSSEIMKEID